MDDAMVFDLDERVEAFSEEVARQPGGELIRRCIGCGTCTAGCPVRAVADGYNPRRLIRMIILGLRREVLSSDFIWLCSTCYTCQERCPQGVKITDIVAAVRGIAAREGFLPESFKLQRELILQMGRLYEINDFDNKKRSKLKLPPLAMNAVDVQRLYRLIKESGS